MALGTQAERSTLISKTTRKSLNSSSKELRGIPKALWESSSLWGGPQSPGWSPVPTQWSYGDGTEEGAKGSGLIKC